LWSWNTTPIWRRNAGMRRSGREPVFWPLTVTTPRLGRSSSAISFSTELLPAPERPVRNTNSPASMRSETSLSASRPFG
jgi:hypothetical protein